MYRSTSCFTCCHKPGTRDSGMVNFIEGVGVGTLDRLTVGEKTVKFIQKYLGPSLGNASDEIAEKAGLLRSDLMKEAKSIFRTTKTCYVW